MLSIRLIYRFFIIRKKGKHTNLKLIKSGKRYVTFHDSFEKSVLFVCDFREFWFLPVSRFRWIERRGAWYQRYEQTAWYYENGGEKTTATLSAIGEPHTNAFALHRDGRYIFKTLIWFSNKKSLGTRVVVHKWRVKVRRYDYHDTTVRKPVIFEQYCLVRAPWKRLERCARTREIILLLLLLSSSSL